MRSRNERRNKSLESAIQLKPNRSVRAYNSNINVVARRLGRGGRRGPLAGSIDFDLNGYLRYV